MNVYTVNLGPDTEYINSFIILSRLMRSRSEGGAQAGTAFAYNHIQIGVACDDQPLETIYVNRRLAEMAADDRITRASIYRQSQAPPSLVEPRESDATAALVLLLISPDEMIDAGWTATGVEVIAEASDATLMTRPAISRHGYLLLMQPGSEIIVRPRWAAPSGAIERIITLGEGGLDLIARDIESSRAVEVASIAA